MLPHQMNFESYWKEVENLISVHLAKVTVDANGLSDCEAHYAENTLIYPMHGSRQIRSCLTMLIIASGQ